MEDWTFSHKWTVIGTGSYYVQSHFASWYIHLMYIPQTYDRPLERRVNSHYFLSFPFVWIKNCKRWKLFSLLLRNMIQQGIILRVPMVKLNGCTAQMSNDLVCNVVIVLLHSEPLTMETIQGRVKLSCNHSPFCHFVQYSPTWIGLWKYLRWAFILNVLFKN